MADILNIPVRNISDLQVVPNITDMLGALLETKIPVGNLPDSLVGEAVTFGQLKEIIALELKAVSPETLQAALAAAELEMQNQLDQQQESLNVIKEEIQAETQAQKDHLVAVEADIQYQIQNQQNYINAVEVDIQAQVNANGIGNRAYKTYALMDADKLNIPAKSKVTVTNDTTESNNGDWQFDGAAFTKSVYDPIEQSKDYTKQYFLNYGLYKSNLPAQFDGAGILLSYFDENGNLVVSRDIYADGIKLVGLPTDVEYHDGGFPAHIANDNIMPLSFDKMGRLIAIPHPSFAKQVIALTGTSVDLSSVVSSDDIVLYGDSLTASGSGYGDFLSAELGARAVINRGSGGQDTLNIVQRQGGAPITVAAFTMPASGSITVTLTNGDPYYSKGGTYTAKINDIAITVAPTATQNQWTVTRTSAGAAINVADGSIIILDEQESFRNKTLILQPGPNFGSPAIAPTRQQMRPYLELTSNAIAHLTPKIKKFLVLGDYTPASSGEDKSKLRDHVVLFNQMLKELVGEAHFIDWHAYGSKQAIYDGIALGLIQSVTAQDIADMDAGFVPNSLTSDGIHANAAFKTLQAKFIAMHIKAKGL